MEISRCRLVSKHFSVDERTRNASGPCIGSDVSIWRSPDADLFRVYVSLMKEGQLFQELMRFYS